MKSVAPKDPKGSIEPERVHTSPSQGLKVDLQNQSRFVGRQFLMESLILAQDERWRRGLGMQVDRTDLV